MRVERIMFRLAEPEARNLISQIAISSWAIAATANLDEQEQ
jgi:hypothetical protein